MKDIFISALSDRLASWSEAFPESTLVHAIQDVDLDHNAEITFWVHKNATANPNVDGQQWLADTMRTILASYPVAKIVVLTNLPNQSESIFALRLGAMGCCHAYTDASVLKEIRAVITHGGIWLGQDMLQRLIEASTQQLGSQKEYVEGLLEKLTGREQEVALEAAKGLSNKEIARILTITERTVKAHLAKIFERLGAKDRLQLALMLNQHAKR
jgi:two-component system nitrate/nitrite response regulator NarL